MGLMDAILSNRSTTENLPPTRRSVGGAARPKRVTWRRRYGAANGPWTSGGFWTQSGKHQTLADCSDDHLPRGRASYQKQTQTVLARPVGCGVELCCAAGGGVELSDPLCGRRAQSEIDEKINNSSIDYERRVEQSQLMRSRVCSMTVSVLSGRGSLMNVPWSRMMFGKVVQ